MVKLTKEKLEEIRKKLYDKLWKKSVDSVIEERKEALNRIQKN